jgi:primosomal protein N' (replication factor Y)
LVQTFNSNHELIEIAQNYDFKRLLNKELETREILQLPPFVEVLKISLRDKNLGNLQNRVKDIFENIKKINTENNFNFRINSAPAVIPKIKNEYIWNIIIR